jgi:P-type conjugative transfer protein TrbG
MVDRRLLSVGAAALAFALVLPAEAQQRRTTPPEGQAAIRAANEEALAPSREASFLNGVQVFAYEPGRIFEVWASPLRVTVISLRQGERLTSMVAGDTVRWQIAETTSGSGASTQTHVVVKPLRGDLTTNLVLTTSERVYLLNLRATNQANSANAAVAWEYPMDAPLDVEAILADPARAAELGARLPLDQLETRYRLEVRGFMASRPAWMPETVFDDGAKTYIRFPAIAAHVELPPLFVIGADGEAQLVNYRVRGQTYVVDQLFERGELRLGPQRVRITRQIPIGGTAPVAAITGGRP